MKIKIHLNKDKLKLRVVRRDLCSLFLTVFLLLLIEFFITGMGYQISLNKMQDKNYEHPNIKVYGDTGENDIEFVKSVINTFPYLPEDNINITILENEIFYNRYGLSSSNVAGLYIGSGRIIIPEKSLEISPLGLRELIAHEIGHHYDQYYLTPERRKIISEWRGYQVHWYNQSVVWEERPQEDFANLYAQLISPHEILNSVPTLYQKKQIIDIMDFKKQLINDINLEATYFHNNHSRWQSIMESKDKIDKITYPENLSGVEHFCVNWSNFVLGNITPMIISWLFAMIFGFLIILVYHYVIEIIILDR